MYGLWRVLAYVPALVHMRGNANYQRSAQRSCDCDHVKSRCKMDSNLQTALENNPGDVTCKLRTRKLLYGAGSAGKIQKRVS